MGTAIACEGLTKRYREVTAVERLDLQVEVGQVFGFVGPNGSGKTTTMRMLLGLIRPTAGVAAVNGTPLPDPRGVTRIGAMIEEPAFYPWLSGRANLQVLAQCGPPLPRGATVDDALERVDMTDVARRRVKAYSQGMRQRLGLALAVMRRPPLLLLDEPTNGMDPGGILQFRALVRSVAAEGGTVFLSSHLLSEVAQVCDRVAVMKAGRLVAEGTVADLAGHAGQVVVTVDPEDQGTAMAVLSAWPSTADGPTRVLVAHDSSQEVNAVLTGAGVLPKEIGMRDVSLEDVFLRLTSTTGTDTGMSETEDRNATASG